MVDIFTALLAVSILCALAGAITRNLMTPPKVWETDDEFKAAESFVDYDELRKEHPHIWIN